MEKSDLLKGEYLDILTDVPLTPIRRFQILQIMEQMTRMERKHLADLVDHTCYYVRAPNVALVGESLCGCEDWHALANEIRSVSGRGY